MERSWQQSISGSQYEQHQLALLSDRRRTLEDEMRRVHQRQLSQARQEKRQRMEQHIQLLERSVDNYEVQMQQNKTTHSDPIESGPLNEILPAFGCPSAKQMLAQILKQNELITLLLANSKELKLQQISSTEDQSSTKIDHKNSELQSPSQISSGDYQHVAFSEKDHDATKAQDSSSGVRIKSAKPNQSVVKWNSPAALPDIQWTEVDELMLEKLQAVDQDYDSFDENTIDWDRMHSNAGQQSDAMSKTGDQKVRDREENRKKTAQLLKSTIGSSASARPRWRIKLDAEKGLVAPFSEDDANCMKPLQIFRSAVWAVIMVLALQKLVLDQLTDQKIKSVQDFEAMLNVYFEATRTWLAKLVKVPLLSFLQDSSADLDLSSKANVAHSKGFAKKFGALLARRPTNDALAPGSKAAIVHETKLMKLRVRAKGISDALIKAIEKQEIPTGILEFWKRLSSDGVYFPACYELFPSELQVLEFSKLGSTRKMQLRSSISDDDRGSPTLYSRFNVVLLNFLFIRILIPHIILQPWQVGIRGSDVTAQVALNLKNVATIMYLICRQLSPLPEVKSMSPLKPVERPVLAANDEDNQTKAEEDAKAVHDEDTDAERQQAETVKETRFLSLDEITSRLIPDASFPTNSTQVQQFVLEQKTRLDQALRLLQIQLHPSEQ